MRDLRHGRGRSEILVGPELGARHILLNRVTIEPGTDPGPYHRHDRAANTYITLTGILEVVADGRTERLLPGDAIFVPPGHPHATHNPTAQPTVLLAVYDQPIEHDFVVVQQPGGTS